jgi:hypothetical protein
MYIKPRLTGSVPTEGPLCDSYYYRTRLPELRLGFTGAVAPV